jgi:hypothetical protein
MGRLERRSSGVMVVFDLFKSKREDYFDSRSRGSIYERNPSVTPEPKREKIDKISIFFRKVN